MVASASGAVQVVLAKVGLENDTSITLVVSRPQNLLKGPMRAGLTAVVMRVNEVDPEALVPLKSRPRGLVARHRRAALGVVERDGGQIQTRAVQVEVPALDPEFPESEADRQRRIHEFAVESSSETLRWYWFWGVCVSQSFSGRQFSVTRIRPLASSFARNGWLVNSFTGRFPSLIRRVSE